MKTKLYIATGAFALYGLGFLCAGLDRAEAAEATPTTITAPVTAPAPATTGTTMDVRACQAGIRGVTLDLVA